MTHSTSKSKLYTHVILDRRQMNPENTPKKDKFICGCCAKTQEFNSDEVIFDYFGKEFTEYEYVIENLAIRPAPKKLLDLVPVHLSNISNKPSIFQTLSFNQPSGEPTLSSRSFEMPHNPKPPPAGDGDFQKLQNHALRVRDASDEFISFKEPTDDSQLKTGQSCLTKPYSPYSNYPYSKPADPRVVKDITELRQTIRTKEYRTTKQILSDLCHASEQSLNIKPKIIKVANNKPMPVEIQDTIETLKFKKPMPQFYTRTENKLFHTPGVYFAEVKNSIESGERQSLNTSNPEPPTIKSEGSDPSFELFQSSYENRQDLGHYYSVDSTAQTEISKACPCTKKDKKNLKWKIIINKHANSKV